MTPRTRFLSAALLLFGTILALPQPTWSQSQVPQSNEPLEVTADNTLEWDRNSQIFIARGNAVAKQGPTAIKAATLTAKYRDGQGGGMELYHITANDNVIIDSRETKAFGDRAVYELDQSLATLTGRSLRLVSPTQVVTARDRFEYWVEQGRLNAIGAAKLIQTEENGQTNTLEADTISAIMKNNEKGERVLDTLTAEGNVRIVTATEILTGDHGIYKSGPNTAEITGDVKIRRGPNILEGTRATVDMNTNVSKLFGGAESGGRVRGVFYPKSEKKKDDDT